MTSPRAASPIASNNPPLILASASPRRRALLGLLGIAPDGIVSPDIDETERPGETPQALAGRLAAEKAEAVRADHPGKLILAGDTVVAVGRRILPKTETEEEARFCLDLLSGRAHRVYSGIALYGPGEERRTRTVETRVKVKRLSDDEIRTYIESDEWRGKAGGYAIQGLFSAHIIQIVGSFYSVVGLPVYEAAQLLAGAGLKPRTGALE